MPHKFFNAQYGEPLRGLIAQGKHLSHIVHFGHEQVFAGATTYTCLLLLDKNAQSDFQFFKVNKLRNWIVQHEALEGLLQLSSVQSNEWNFVIGKDNALFEKLKNWSKKLDDVAQIFVGLQTSADEIFILNYIDADASSLELSTKSGKHTFWLEKKMLRPVVSGVDVKRYAPLPKRQYLLFPL